MGKVDFVRQKKTNLLSQHDKLNYDTHVSYPFLELCIAYKNKIYWVEPTFTILEQRTSDPGQEPTTFSTHSDNQSQVLIHVFEGERPMTKDNHPLGKFELSGIMPAPRGVPQIEVTFEVARNMVRVVNCVHE